MDTPHGSQTADRSTTGRRRFLRGVGASAGAAAFASSWSVLAAETAGANERIGVGFIGTGGRAQAHINIVNPKTSSVRSVFKNITNPLLVLTNSNVSIVMIQPGMNASTDNNSAWTTTTAAKNTGG